MYRAWTHPWLQLFDRLLERPLMPRAAFVMGIFLIGQIPTAGLSLWAVNRSDQIAMRPFTALVIGGTAVVALSALALSLVARRDPHGRGLLAQGVLLVSASAYACFGVAIAHLLGFWSSPFALFPAVAVLIVGILFGRVHGWTALIVSVSLAATLEGLRLLGFIGYAPALRVREVDGAGELTRVIGTSVPLVAFTAVAVSLAFGLLSLSDRQRRDLARSHDVIRRYVPAQVADAVLDGRDPTALERRKLTVFFSDVVGFTELTERLEPEELARVLDDYFSEMTRIAEHYDGTIDELIGDAVLIFFGAPTATDDHDHALRAVHMAVDMQAAVVGLNRRWESDGIDAALAVRVGINTGIVMVGNVGTGERRKYAALGRGVNLAARLQNHCTPGRVLLSHSTWLLVRDEVECVERGEVELKGVARPTRIHEVLPPATL